MSQYLSRVRMDELEQLADAVLDEYGREVPIDPVRILNQLRLSVSYNDYGDSFDGLLEYKGGRFHVYCNTRRCPRGATRSRFTLAHELGHYFIDEHRRCLIGGVSPHQSVAGFLSGNRVEREADFFASSLLMPRERFTKPAHHEGLTGVLRLARDFDVSVTAAAIRFASLDLEPCAVFYWLDGTVRWRRLSPTFFEVRFMRTVEDLVDIPRDCATAKVIRAGKSGEVIGCATTAASWFRAISNSSDHNLLLMEQAVGLGQYGAVTMLFRLGGGA